MTDQYAVVGHPVAHSKSPLIHGKFADALNEDMSYGLLEPEVSDFEVCVKDFFATADNKGLNVTVPFKERAFAMCERLTERAHMARAVNTLYLDSEGKLVGDNTDGVGLVRDLKENQEMVLKGKKILIVGAGGAVRGVIAPILNESPARLVVCNRTLSKVDDLIQSFAMLGSIEKKAFEDVSEPFDIVINGTSASLAGEVPPLRSSIIDAQSCVYDMMYQKGLTAFNAWAQETGAGKVVDGLGMLVEQAAEAFKVWRGKRPATQSVIEELRA